MLTIFPQLVRCASSYDEEKLAHLTHHVLGNQNPLKTRQQYEDILAKLGILLCYESWNNTYGSLLIREHKQQWNPIFCIRKDLDWMEQRFLIAKFLGHVLFDHQVRVFTGHARWQSKIEEHSPYQNYLSTKRPRPLFMKMECTRLDWLADEFAGAFLIPKPWLKDFVEMEKDPLRISSHFSVPLEFLHARVKHIRQKHGVQTPYEQKRMQIFAYAQGDTKGEPQRT